MNLVFGSIALVAGCAISGISGADPELRVVRDEGPARLNQVYTIRCEVSWAGDAAAFAILPAEFDAIDWGTMAVTGAEARVVDGVNIVTQYIAITPKKLSEPREEGFNVPEIRITYLNPEATPPAEKAVSRTDPPDSSASPSLRAEPFKLEVRPARSLFWISGGLGASLLLIVIGWRVAAILRRRRRPISVSTKPDPAGADLGPVTQALHRARQHRLDGKFYEYYQTLAGVADRCDPRLAATLRSRAQDVGYGGRRPTEDDLDGDFRTIERALARLKEEHQA